MSQGTLKLYKTSVCMSPIYRGTRKVKKTCLDPRLERGDWRLNPWASPASALISYLTHISDLNSHGSLVHSQQASQCRA